MKHNIISALFLLKPRFFEDILDAEYEPYRESLTDAGLSEEALRQMDPDDRVAALEQAALDPYDYIYLACG